MDMSQINAAIEGEKQRAQSAKIEAALTEILATVRELKAEVAALKNAPRAAIAEAKRPGGELNKTTLQTAKRLGEQTQE